MVGKRVGGRWRKFQTTPRVDTVRGVEEVVGDSPTPTLDATCPTLTIHFIYAGKPRNFSIGTSKAYSSIAMIARSASMPSPFSELVTTNSG
jgi:hypothetical protein